MTKQEAINLQSDLENLIKEALNENNVEISLSLSGRLQIKLSNNKINFNKNLTTVDYIIYSGDYSEMKEIIKTIKEVLAIHYDEFQLLIWSYENRRELQEDKCEMRYFTPKEQEIYNEALESMFKPTGDKLDL